MKTTLAVENTPLRNLHTQSIPDQPNLLNMQSLLRSDQPEKLHTLDKIEVTLSINDLKHLKHTSTSQKIMIK